MFDPLEDVEEGRAQLLVVVHFVVSEEVHSLRAEIHLQGVDDPFHDDPAKKFPPVLLILLKNSDFEQEVGISQVDRNHQVGKHMLDPKRTNGHQDFAETLEREDEGRSPGHQAPKANFLPS